MFCALLSFSAAEYLCPVWDRSAHASHLDPFLNESCRLITACLKPTNNNNLHLLAGIVPPEIRRKAAIKQKSLRQICDNIPPYVVQLQALPTKVIPKKSFLHCVDSLEGKITTWREEAWERKLEELPSSNYLNIKPDESLPPGSQLEWKMYRCLNRFRSGVTRTKTELKKLGFTDPSTSVICRCGEENGTIQHQLTCSLLDEPCSIANL